MSSFVKQNKRQKGKIQELGKLFLSSLVHKELLRKILHRTKVGRGIKTFSVHRPDWTLDNTITIDAVLSQSRSGLGRVVRRHLQGPALRCGSFPHSLCSRVLLESAN